MMLMLQYQLHIEWHIGKMNDVEQMVLYGKENDEMSTN